MASGQGYLREMFNLLLSSQSRILTLAIIMAAQDQAHWLRQHTWGTVPSDYCRKCGQFAESVKYIIAGCAVLAHAATN